MKKTELNNPIKLDDLHQQFATSGVYVIYCVPSDVYYIGQSQVVIKRLIDHFDALDHGRHGNNLLQGDYEKFGKDNFLVDMIRDMPNSSDAERLRQETKEIQRYKMHHRTLYNKVLQTIKIGEGKQNPNQKSQTRASSQVVEYRDGYTPEIAEQVGEKSTCEGCGSTGILYNNIFKCDDNINRCEPCIEKRLDTWGSKFGMNGKRTTGHRLSQSYSRWQLSKTKHLADQIASHINSFANKYEQIPEIVFINVGNSAHLKNVNVTQRKITPLWYLDIPLAKI